METNHEKIIEELSSMLGFGDTIYLLARTYRATFVDAFCIDASDPDVKRPKLVPIGARLAMLTDHQFIFHRSGFNCQDKTDAEAMVQSLSHLLFQDSNRLAVSWI